MDLIDIYSTSIITCLTSVTEQNSDGCCATLTWTMMMLGWLQRSNSCMYGWPKSMHTHRTSALIQFSVYMVPARGGRRTMAGFQGIWAVESSRSFLCISYTYFRFHSGKAIIQKTPLVGYAVDITSTHCSHNGTVLTDVCIFLMLFILEMACIATRLPEILSALPDQFSTASWIHWEDRMHKHLRLSVTHAPDIYMDDASRG